MSDNAGYRPTDDSALRWEDCHCAKCGEPDKQCKCVARPERLIPSKEQAELQRQTQAVIDEACRAIEAAIRRVWKS